ncbi:MAG: SPOR domain-containing protein [Bacteroidaceae bacterium]|nr:SPOR domain-containing protein [Bacteroidaceae bacterium]
MKKIALMGFAFVAAFAMSSCKSGESAYKKAYEKAQAQQSTTTSVTQVNTSTAGAQEGATQVSVTPVQTITPVQTVTPVTDYSNVTVRTEDVTLVNGAGLKAYSVVVGSFGVQANASALQKKLSGQGYQAQVVKSPSNMYRVILSTHNDKVSAAQSRDKVRGTYPDAWLLYQK